MEETDKVKGHGRSGRGVWGCFSRVVRVKRELTPREGSGQSVPGKGSSKAKARGGERLVKFKRQEGNQCEQLGGGENDGGEVGEAGAWVRCWGFLPREAVGGC